MSVQSTKPGFDIIVLHPLVLRIVHWTFALAVLVLIGSGWRIHNFGGFFGQLHIPVWMTIGGTVPDAVRVHGEIGLAGALLWHFFAMWLLFASFVIYLVWAIASGHFAREILPLRPAQAIRDVRAFLGGKLGHEIGMRNAVQRLLYAGALAAMAVMILTGIAIWKPVQFSWLAWLFGGYSLARYIHFLGMVALVGFVVVHVSLVALVPAVLPPMITGKARIPVRGTSHD